MEFTEKVHVVDFNIESYLEESLDVLIVWYTRGNARLKDLSPVIQDKIKAVVMQNNNLPMLGEFVSVAFLLRQNFELLTANITRITYGNGDEKGIDAIFKKDNTPYFVEVKTNVGKTKTSFSALKSKLNTQLDSRYKDKVDHLEFEADNIKETAELNRKDLNEWKKWFLNNVELLGVLVANKGKVPELKNKTHNIIVLLLEKLEDLKIISDKLVGGFNE